MRCKCSLLCFRGLLDATGAAQGSPNALAQHVLKTEPENGYGNIFLLRHNDKSGSSMHALVCSCYSLQLRKAELRKFDFHAGCLRTILGIPQPFVSRALNCDVFPLSDAMRMRPLRKGNVTLLQHQQRRERPKHIWGPTGLQRSKLAFFCDFISSTHLFPHATRHQAPGSWAPRAAPRPGRVTTAANRCTATHPPPPTGASSPELPLGRAGRAAAQASGASRTTHHTNFSCQHAGRFAAVC